MTVSPVSASWLVALVLTPGLASAQTCESVQSAVDALKLNIQQDQSALKRLGFTPDIGEFETIADASAEQRNQMLQLRFKLLLDSLTAVAMEKAGSIAGEALALPASLPSGYVALDSLKANIYIKQLANPNGPVASFLGEAAATPDQTAKAALLQTLTGAVEAEESEYDTLFADASMQQQSLRHYRNLTTILSQLLSYPQAATVLQTGTSGADLTVAFGYLLWGNFDLSQMNQLTAEKAKALARLTASLTTHVRDLKLATAQLETCNNTVKIIYFSQQQARGSYIFVDLPSPKYEHLSVGFLQGGRRYSDGPMSGGGKQGIYSADGRFIRATNKYVTTRKISDGNGFRGPLPPGEWKVVICPEPSVFVDSRSSDRQQRMGLCVDFSQYEQDPANPGSKRIKPVPAEPLIITPPIVINPPAHAAALVQVP